MYLLLSPSRGFLESKLDAPTTVWTCIKENSNYLSESQAERLRDETKPFPSEDCILIGADKVDHKCHEEVVDLFIEKLATWDSEDVANFIDHDFDGGFSYKGGGQWLVVASGEQKDDADVQVILKELLNGFDSKYLTARFNSEFECQIYHDGNEGFFVKSA